MRDAPRSGAPPDSAACKAEVLKRLPGFSIREHCVPILHYRRESDLAHHLDSLRAAGLPE